MKKLPLKYFVRLIEGELVEKHNEFHLRFARMASAGKGRHFDKVEYDAEHGTVRYEIPNTWQRGGPPMEAMDDLPGEIYSKVKRKASKSKEIIYERLSSGVLTKRETFYRQLLTALDRLINIVADEPVYAKYPFVSEALLDIKEFAASRNPQLAEQETTFAPKSEAKPGVGFTYRFREAGRKPEHAGAITQRCLGNLFERLRNDLSLIAADTTLMDFRAVFSGQVVFTPIKWMGSKSQLRAFIKAIEPRLVLPGRSRVPKLWLTAAACFVHRRGGSLSAEQISNTGTPKDEVPRRKEIEEVASLLR